MATHHETIAMSQLSIHAAFSQENRTRLPARMMSPTVARMCVIASA
jgi:hypothetical protein